MDNFEQNSTNQNFDSPNSNAEQKTGGPAYSDKYPGPTQYDKAKDFPPNPPRQPEPPQGYARPGAPAQYETCAIASLILGVVSLLFLIFVPFLGIFLSVISAIVGIVLSVMGKKSKYHAMAMAGLIISIVDLAFVVVMVILLAIFGGTLLGALFNIIQQNSASFPHSYNGGQFYFH